ncbi:MAG: hypothetical protein GTO14_14800 [Anaerolineales bacterium]|nr:hypothetical protein [Anaerolineales bacterium]
MSNDEIAQSILDNQSVESDYPSKSSRGLIFFLVLLVGLLIVGLFLAFRALISHPDQAETLRDIVIIFLAFEMFVIGLVLILMMIQVARLATMLQNEIKPILDSTNETISTLRGTSQFLSEKMVKPVIRANSSIAAFRRVVNLIIPGRSRKPQATDRSERDV